MGSSERRRGLYKGGRPGRAARWSNRLTAAIAASGLLGWWCVRLETVNPVSGAPLTLPLVTAKADGHRYLVSMLGQGARWVRNPRRAQGARPHTPVDMDAALPAFEAIAADFPVFEVLPG